MKAILREAERAPQCIQLNNRACSAPASKPSSAVVSWRFSFAPGTARASCPASRISSIVDCTCQPSRARRAE